MGGVENNSENKTKNCENGEKKYNSEMVNNNEFPYKIEFVEEKLNKQLLEDFTGERTGFVQVGDEKWFFPSGYIEASKYIYNFNVRQDDVWVVTYPRSGTTWTQELVWLVANNLDYKEAADVPLPSRFPFFEFSMFVHDEVKKEFLAENAYDPKMQDLVEEVSAPGWEILDKQKTRRFIKTHIPFSLLPPTLLTSGCKIIYVARNPKDVAVSFYHLNKLYRTQGYTGDFLKYWGYFKNNLQSWTPYWSHIKEGWKHKDNPNVLFMFYEDMNKDLPMTIQKIGEFLNKSYDTDQINGLVEHLSIANFRKNPSVNCQILRDLGITISGEQTFIRKGKTGGWSEEFTPELLREADEWIKENLKGTNIVFPKI